MEGASALELLPSSVTAHPSLLLKACLKSRHLAPSHDFVRGSQALAKTLSESLKTHTPVILPNAVTYSTV